MHSVLIFLGYIIHIHNIDFHFYVDDFQFYVPSKLFLPSYPARLKWNMYVQIFLKLNAPKRKVKWRGMKLLCKTTAQLWSPVCQKTAWSQRWYLKQLPKFWMLPSLLDLENIISLLFPPDLIIVLHFILGRRSLVGFEQTTLWHHNPKHPSNIKWTVFVLSLRMIPWTYSILLFYSNQSNDFKVISKDLNGCEKTYTFTKNWRSAHLHKC